MIVRVEVRPALLAWARQRSGRDVEDLNQRFTWLHQWERGEGHPPTLRQLEAFATATHTPIGILMLPEPPAERLPLADYRTLGDQELDHPSVDLLDTIHLAQQRQAWYRSHAQSNDFGAVSVVGSINLATEVGEAGSRIRDELGFNVEDRTGSWTDALRDLTARAEALGILVMASGVVGSDNHRNLDPDEFRGFSLVDDLAPVVFVNGADTKAAQNFTLVHELAHVWLGEGGVDNPGMGRREQHRVERWCNAVAAEVLVPEAELLAEFDQRRSALVQLEDLARRFKVSTLVVLHSLFDAHVLNWDAYQAAYVGERDRVRDLAVASDGGNFYNTTPVRASKRFTRTMRDELVGAADELSDWARARPEFRVDEDRRVNFELGVGVVADQPDLPPAPQTLERQGPGCPCTGPWEASHCRPMRREGTVAIRRRFTISSRRSWYGFPMSGTYTVSMGDRGRLVVPAEMRARGGFDQGDVLVLIDTPGGVVMVGRDRLRDLVRADLAGHDLVADLIAERRQAAHREDAA